MRKLFIFAIALLLITLNAGKIQAAEAEEYLHEAAVSIAQKDYGKAIECYSQALAIKEEDGKRYFNRGEIYFERGKIYLIQKQFDLALADFTKANEERSSFLHKYEVARYLELVPLCQQISLDDKNIDAYQKRAKMYLNMKNYEFAIVDYSEIIELQPANVDAYMMRGSVYYYLALYDLALSDYNKAIQIDPSKKGLYYARGMLYSRLQKFDLSIADFTKAIELNLNWAYYQRAILYENKKQYDLAIKDYNAVKDISEYMAFDYYSHRGKVYFELKEYDLAIADFSKALEAKKSDKEAFATVYSARAEAYGKKNQYDLAIKDYTLAIHSVSYDISYYYKRGSMYSQMHQDDLARADYNKIISASENEMIINENNSMISSGKDYVIVNFYKAMTFEALGKNQDAVMYYHKYLQKRLSNYPDGRPTKYDFQRYMDEIETKSEVEGRIKYAQERLKVLSGYKI